MKSYAELKSMFKTGADSVVHDERTQSKMSKSAMAIATGFGFGLTLEAGLATIFGVAASGAISVVVGAAVMLAYLNMPQQHHHYVLKMGQDSLDKLSRAVGAKQFDEVELDLSEDTPDVQDKRLISSTGMAVKVISDEVHDGDVIHINAAELNALINHKLTARPTL